MVVLDPTSKSTMEDANLTMTPDSIPSLQPISDGIWRVRDIPDVSYPSDGLVSRLGKSNWLWSRSSLLAVTTRPMDGGNH